jgi:hypothetical protein
MLSRTGGIKGNLVPDAFLAALAIESGSEWISTDRDYYRFPGLRVRHPGEQRFQPILKATKNNHYSVHVSGVGNAPMVRDRNTRGKTDLISEAVHWAKP